MSDEPARPLVTFAVFAYNQEKYIREAVEGAFAQTYQPLEIILSDDCSTDRTFEIMQEMAEAYEGPHEVRVRRSTLNRGTWCHIKDVHEEMKGSILVVAAGDDISLPCRTETLIMEMLQKDSAFAASNFNRIPNVGQLIQNNCGNDYSHNYIWNIVHYHDKQYFASGATAAYSKDFLKGAFQATRRTIQRHKIFNEDAVFAAYAIAIGASLTHYCKSGLVNYRVVPTSLSNFRAPNRDFSSHHLEVDREAFRSRSRLAFLAAVLEISDRYPSLRRRLRCARIDKDMRLAVIEMHASDPILFKRLATFTKIRNIRELRIVAARMLGRNAHAFLRYVTCRGNRLKFLTVKSRKQHG